MSVRTKILTLGFAAVLALPTAAHATDDNGGFGASFANEGHAGFETPSSYIDGSSLQDIEPAAGTEIDAEAAADAEIMMDADTQSEILHDGIHGYGDTQDPVAEDVTE